MPSPTECYRWHRMAEKVLLWEEGGLLCYSHPSQGCTAPGTPSQHGQAPCPTRQLQLVPRV